MTMPKTNRRNAGGRFAANRSAVPFDLEGSVQRLYTLAEKKGDFTGCATLARVIRDLRAAPADPAAPALNMEFLEYLNAAEANELLAFTARARELRVVGMARMAAGEPKTIMRADDNGWVDGPAQESRTQAPAALGSD